MTTNVRLASAPINWGIESPDRAGNPMPDDVLQNSRLAGYTGFELGPLHFLGADAAAIGYGSKRTISLPWPFGCRYRWKSRSVAALRRRYVRRSRRCRRLAPGICWSSDFGDPARLAVISQVEEHPETWWSDDDWAEVRRSFLAIAELGKEYGIDVSVHPHVGGHIESGREIEKALDAIDGASITVCIDTGHIRIGGTDSIPLMRRLGSRVTHIHAKDVEPGLLWQMQSGDIGLQHGRGSRALLRSWARSRRLGWVGGGYRRDWLRRLGGRGRGSTAGSGTKGPIRFEHSKPGVSCAAPRGFIVS